MAIAPIIVAYFTAWSIYGRSYFVTNIPGNKLTHINYAFASIDSNGQITLDDPWADVQKAFDGDKFDQSLRGNFNQLIKLKQKYPHLRTLIAVGGWSRSGKFSDVAVNPASRSKFATSCIKFIQKYSFDGIDLDWEYPVSGGLPGNSYRSQDKQNFVLLLKEIRRQLDQITNKTYLLTVATGSGTQRIADLNLLDMVTYVDWINVMTYDFHGPWNQRTGHNAPLYKNDAELVPDVAPSFSKSRFNCHAAIQAYITAGVPREKLIMGMPLYGRGWKGVTNTAQNGFSQLTSNELPVGTWEKGVFEYDHLEKSFIPWYTRYWDEQSKVPFLFNTSTGIWISYDDLESFKYKNDYIKKERLGGAMFWELSGDREGKLIDTTYNSLNCIIVPSSTRSPKNIVRSWKPWMIYKVSEQVIFKGKIYQCIKAHKSLFTKPPTVTTSFWKYQAPPKPNNSSNSSLQCNCKSNECCSQWGFCGTTHGYCGVGCRSGPCFIGSNHDTSPQCNCNPNECCSKWNFCGTTHEYCADGCQSGPCFLINTSTQPDNGGKSRQWHAQISYTVNDQIIYNGIMYRCRVAHTSESDWTPPVVPPLWRRI